VQKTNQNWCRHFFIVNHKVHFALIRNGGNYVDVVFSPSVSKLVSDLQGNNPLNLLALKQIQSHLPNEFLYLLPSPEL